MFSLSLYYSLRTTKHDCSQDNFGRETDFLFFPTRLYKQTYLNNTYWITQSFLKLLVLAYCYLAFVQL